MITHTDHRSLVALAGDDFLWTAYAGTQSYPAGDAFRGLVAILNTAQDGLCVACGEGLAGERTQVCHIVSGGPKGRGYVGGNLYLGHVDCNDLDREVYGAIVPLDSLVRADLILAERPSRSAMLAAVPTDDGTSKARRLALREAHRNG